MAAVTIQADRGISLQGQLAWGRGGIQNGSFSRRVALGNTFGNLNGECFIDVDNISRLRFPPASTFTAQGVVSTLINTAGAVAQSAQAVFDYTFVTTAAGVTTITANVAAVGFSVTKSNIPNNIGGTEDVILITGLAPATNTRFYVDIAIANQGAQVAGGAQTRQLAPAATVQAGRY
jgi:hypothetical protein